MTKNRKSPPFVFLMLVGTSLLTSATLGHGFFSRDSTIKVLRSDSNASAYTNDNDYRSMNLRPAYVLQNYEDVKVNSICDIACSNANQKFKYVIGTTYQYLYEGDLRTFIIRSEFTGVKITANVDIEVVSACHFVLKLNNVTLREYDPSNDNKLEAPPMAILFKDSLERQPLSFTYDDGTIRAICPSSDEEPSVLNIKRAILSQFQNTMPYQRASVKVKETDISGTCETHYYLALGSMKRIKNLNRCKGGSLGQTFFQGVQYQTKAPHPILQAYQECRQEIDNSQQIIQKVKCRDQFWFIPLEDQFRGASTTVSTMLTYHSSVRQDQTTDFSKIEQIRSTLVFDHRFSAQEVAESFTEAQETLRILEQESDVTQNTPQLFSKLTKKMKKLDDEKLQRIVSTASNDRAKSFVYDVLPLLETAASVKVMKGLFGSVDPSRKDIWISSLAFVQEPTKELLDEAQHFLELDFERSALSVSSLAYNYRKSDGFEGKNEDVFPIIQALFSKIKSNCQATSPEEYKTLKVLKAIGNIGMSKNATLGLISCAKNEETSMAIRVAAIDAFRRQDCLPENLKFLDAMLADVEQDSELRITAYLQRAKCFDKSFFVYIKEILEKEKTNQVGSFIWTHLINMAESESPLKSNVAKLLEDIKSLREFDLNEKKFSKNIEWSSFDKKQNVGAAAESNLIWSQSSFVPRSTSLNFTVDLFGQSVNLLEFGTRVQGMEGILENIFRSKGKQAPSGSPNGEDAFDSTFTKKKEETSLAFYVRIFGHELVTEQLSLSQSFSMDIEEMVRRVNFMDFLTMLAKENQMEFTRSYKILVGSLSFPTQIGLPLKLSLEGTATVELIANGKFDILQLLSGSPGFEIRGQIRPSSAMVIIAEMGVDFKCVNQGIRFVSTVHSSTVLDGKIQLRDGNSFSLDINMPENRINLFSIVSKFYILGRNEQSENINSYLSTEGFHRCTESATLFGINLCLDSSDSYMKVYLLKADTHIGYHLSSSFVKSLDDPTEAFTLKFDTPQSKIDRLSFINLELHRSAKRIIAQFRTPSKTVAFDSTLILLEDHMKIEASLLVDEMVIGRAVAELQENRTGGITHYASKLDLESSFIGNITMHGYLKYNDSRIEIGANLTNLFPNPVNVLFCSEDHNRARRYQLNLTSHWLTLFLKSTIDNANSVQRFNSTFHLQMPYKNLDYKADCECKASENDLAIDTYVSSHDKKLAFATFNINNSALLPTEMAIETELDVLGYGFKVSSMLKGTASVNYSVTAEGELRTPKFSKRIQVKTAYELVNDSRHQLHLKTGIEGLNPVEFFGHLNTDLNNLQIKAAILYNGDTYSTGFNYLYDSTTNTIFNCTFDAGVTYPGAGHLLKVNVVRRNMEIGAESHLKLTTSNETQHSNGISKRKLILEYKLSGQIVIHPYTPVFFIKMEWPDNFIQVKAGGKYEIGNWLATTEDFKGEFAFKSSIKSAEEFLISFQLDHCPKNITSTAILTWAPTQNITANFAIDNSMLQLNFTTPFENYRSIRFKTLTTMQSTQARPFSHTTGLTWDSKFVSFAIHCNTTRLDNFNGKATISTTFEGFESISLVLKDRLNGSDYNGSAELIWPRNQTMLLLIESRNAISRGQVSFEGRVAVKRSYSSQMSESNHLSWNYKHNSTTINSLLELGISHWIYSAQLTGQSKLTKACIIIGKLEIKTPHRGLRNFGAEFEHSHNISGVDTSQKLLMNLEERSMILSHTLQYVRRNILVYGIKVTTPFRNYENLEIKLDNNMQGPSTTTKTLVDLGPVGRGKLEGRFENKNNGEFSGKYELTTSNESLQKTTIEFENNRIEGKWKTSWNVKVNDQMVMTAETRLLSAVGETKFQMDLITPWEEMRLVRFNFSSNGSAKNLSASVELEHNQLSGRISSNFWYDVRDPEKTGFYARLTSPLSSPNKIVFRASKTGAWEMFNSSLGIEIEDEMLDVEPKTLTQCLKKFVIFRSCNLSLQLNHQLKNSSGWTNNAFVKYNGHILVFFSSEYFWTKADEVKFGIALHTPEEHSLNFYHKGDLDDFKTELELKMEPMTIANVLTFKMPSENEIMINYTEMMNTGEVSIPFEANFFHNGSIEDFRTEFRMTNLWKENENIVFRLIHHGQWNDFNTELTAEAGISHYKNILKFHFGGPGDITLVLTAETPHAGYDQFRLDFKHIGVMQDFSSELKVTSPIRNYERALLVLVHKGRPEEFRSTLKLTTSHPSIPSAEVVLDHRISQSDLSNVLKIVLPGDNTLESNLAFNFESQMDYQTTWSLKTPFEQYDFFSIALKQETILGNNIMTQKSMIKIKTPFRDYREIKEETTKVVENEGRTIRSRRLITMVPHRTFEENYYLNLGMMLSKAEFSYTLNSSEPWFNGYHISTNYSSGATNKLSGLLETPFEELKKLSFKSHSEESVFSFNLVVNKDLSVDIALRHVGVFKLNCVVETSLLGFSRITLTAEHSGPIDNFRTNVFFQKPDYESTISLRHEGHPRKFNTILTIDHVSYGETKTIKSELNVSLEDVINYQLMFSIDTPFSCFRNLHFNHGIKYSNFNHLAYIDVTFNDEKKFDVEYKNLIDGSSLSIMIRSPYQLGSLVSVSDTSGSADINWNTTKPNRNVRFEFGLLTSITSSRSSNGVNFTVITDDCRAGFGIDLTIDESSLSHDLGMHWQKENDKGDFSYEIKGCKRGRERSGEQTEGSLRVTTGSSIDAVIGISHSIVGGSFYTVLYKEDKIANTQVALKHNIDMAANKVTHTIKIEHPRFPKDIVLTTQVSVDKYFQVMNKLSNGSSALSRVDDETLETDSGDNFKESVLVGRCRVISLNQALQLNYDIYKLDASIRDDDSETKNKVIGAIRAYHSPSALDLTVTGAWEETSTETILIGSVSYKISSTGETKKMIIQSFYNEEEKEIMIELETPITSLSLRTVNRRVDMDEGIVCYDIILESPDFFQFKTTLDFSLPKKMLDFRCYTSKDRFFRAIGRMNFWGGSFALSHFDPETPEGDNSVTFGWSINEESFLVGHCHVKPNVLEDWTRQMSPGAMGSEATMGRIARSYMELKQLLDEDAVQKGAKMRESIQPYGPAFREMKEAVEEFMEGVEKMYNSNFLFIKDIIKGLRILSDALRDQLHVCMTKTAAALQDFGRAVKEKVYEVFYEMKQLWLMCEMQLKVLFKPHFSVVREKIESYLEDLKFKFRTLIEDAQKDPVLAEVIKAVDSFFRVSEIQWTVWDETKRSFEFQVFLAPDLLDLVDVLIKTDLKALIYSIEGLSSLIEFMHSTELTEKNFYEFLLSDAYASISGVQHYRTFDGRIYHFAGNCTYLLARDFSDKTFTAFVTYDSKNGLPMKKSIGITTDGRMFEIYPDGKIAVDGTRIELPFTFKDTTIHRTGGNEIQLYNSHGFMLTCDIAHDHCGLTVSGWYHGKLAGLFGINDFEPENDMTSSRNVKESVPGKSASSWALGSRCGNANMAVKKSYMPFARHYQTCEVLFGVNSFVSPLKNCFKTISPLDYFQICLNAMSKPAENQALSHQFSCNAAAAYVKDCRAQGIYVKMPKQCVQCGDLRAPPGHFEGDTFQMIVESQDKMADIVFVLQSGQCNKRAFNRMRNLAEQLQKTLVESEGIASVKYALVGYGGSYGRPHIHTLASQVFNTFDKLSRVSFDTNSTSGITVDGMTAIHYAAKMPFRTGASKTIIFIPCNLCSEDGKSGLLFSDLHMTLVQSDIRLHVLLPELFNVTLSSPSIIKPAIIFGIDNSKAYTSQNEAGNELGGITSLRPFVRMPRDYCAALTHNSKGSIFSSKQWIETPVKRQKFFVNIFTGLVARRAQPAISQVCSCRADNIGMGVSGCSDFFRKNFLFWGFTNFEDFPEVSQRSAITNARGHWPRERPRQTSTTRRALVSRNRQVRY